MHTTIKLIAACIVTLWLSACVTAPSVPLETLSGDEKALHDVMARQLEALGRRDAKALEAVYVDASTQPRQLVEKTFPALVTRPWTYRISRAESFVVLGSDAMARFTIDGSYQQWFLQQRVAAVYEKHGAAWKLSSVTEAQ
jgi:hypothetical protein